MLLGHKNTICVKMILHSHVIITKQNLSETKQITRDIHATNKNAVLLKRMFTEWVGTESVMDTYTQLLPKVT